MKKLVGFLLVIIFLGFGTARANASALSGWAWSETFGWMSFNSSDPSAGGGPYAVSVDDATGNLSGYAWSEYLGWVSFNAVDVPVACSASPQANVNLVSGAVVGWAYATTYGASADGCIELSGVNHTSPTVNGTGGVTYIPSTGKFVGYAWGGNTTEQTNAGWILFDTTTAPVRCATCAGVGPGSLSGTCTAVSSIPAYTPPNQNVSPNTKVTFQANPTSGTAPYHYKWNGEAGWDTQPSINRFEATYSTSAAGPTVIIKDSLDVTSASISCPAVTVLGVVLPTNLTIGRTAATATNNSFTSKKSAPFALKWNIALSDDYSCSTNISPSDAGSWNTPWSNLFNGSLVTQGSSKTWSGNTGTSLNIGNVSSGMYQFNVSCTSAGSETVLSSCDEEEFLPSNHRGDTNSTYSCHCSSYYTNSGWGTGTYTEDTSLCTAAKHSGVTIPGNITYTIVANPLSFVGSSKNGITTTSFSSMPGYRIQIPYSTSVPTAPMNLFATPMTASSIALTWSPSSLVPATSYTIYRSSTNSTFTTPVASGVAGTNFLDQGLTSGTLYYYKVSGVNASGEGLKSNAANAHTLRTTYGPVDCGDLNDAWQQYCAYEGEYCDIPANLGTVTVRYGIWQSWNCLIAENTSVSCTNENFGGDPFEGEYKSCGYRLGASWPGGECVPDQGGVCESGADACGQTNWGTVNCDGTCSAVGGSPVCPIPFPPGAGPAGPPYNVSATLKVNASSQTEI